MAAKKIRGEMGFDRGVNVAHNRADVGIRHDKDGGNTCDKAPLGRNKDGGGAGKLWRRHAQCGGSCFGLRSRSRSLIGGGDGGSILVALNLHLCTTT